MSDVFDLYADDFPHGSAAGFERGCKTMPVCTNFGSSELLTCREAHSARGADYTLSRQPADTILPRATEPPPHVQAAKKNAARAAQHRGDLLTPSSPAAPLEPATPAPERDIAAPEPDISAPGESRSRPAGPAPRRRRPAIDDPEFPHGSVGGYRRGCTSVDDCPALTAGGLSCRQAMNEYNREYAARRKAANGEVLGQARPSVKDLEPCTAVADEISTGEESVAPLPEEKASTREPEAATDDRDGGQPDPIPDAVPEPNIAEHAAFSPVEPETYTNATQAGRDAIAKAFDLDPSLLDGPMGLLPKGFVLPPDPAHDDGIIQDLETSLHTAKGQLVVVLQQRNNAIARESDLRSINSSLAKNVHELEQQTADQAETIAQLERALALEVAARVAVEQLVSPAHQLVELVRDPAADLVLEFSGVRLTLSATALQ
jgi:hypothetical protein